MNYEESRKFQQTNISDFFFSSGNSNNQKEQ